MKIRTISIQNRKELLEVSKALANELRLSIIFLLSETSYTVNEIAAKLDIPLSTAAMNIKILENADIIRTEYSPGKRGLKKLCSRKFDSLNLELENPRSMKNFEEYLIDIPTGSYNDCNVEATCGMAGRHSFLIPEDMPEFFFAANRHKAEILWFTKGYVNYKVTNPITKHMQVHEVEISFEACSEAPNYRSQYPSDITVRFNDIILGTWICKGDYGGRPGILNPKWWSSSLTQYGELSSWKITNTGTFLNNIKISDITLKEVDLYRLFWEIRISVEEDAKNKGGINIFGRHFGDHDQNINVKIQYY